MAWRGYMVALLIAIVALTAFYGLCMAALGWMLGADWQHRRDCRIERERVNAIRRSYGLPPVIEHW